MAQHSALLKKGTFRQIGSRRMEGAAAGAAPAAAPGTVVEPSVRIVQERPDGVVLEVTCPCGRTTLIQCDYVAAPPAAPQPPGPAGPGDE